MQASLKHIENFAKYFRLYHPKKMLMILSDEKRSPDFYAINNFLPDNAFLIIRNQSFASKNLLKNKILSNIDIKLAHKNKIRGVHIPTYANAPFKSQKHNLLITASAHNIREIIRAKNFNADYILLSKAFKSQSDTKGKVIGTIKIAKLAQYFPQQKFIALGGINQKTQKRLKDLKISGIAGISFY